MARLGSVLGGILAELSRARLVADSLTRDLVSEYESDPVLASFSVPRVVIGDATIALRFIVQDLEEAAPAPPDAGAVGAEWSGHAAAAAVPSALTRLGLSDADRQAVLAAVERQTGRPTAAEVREALAGRPQRAARTTAEPLLQAWTAIPPAVRSRLGTKATFRRRLGEALAEELATFVERKSARELVAAALASTLDIAIRREDLPADSAQLQEIRLTLRAEDLDLITIPRDI
jgi:hypothetical protein